MILNILLAIGVVSSVIMVLYCESDDDLRGTGFFSFCAVGIVVLGLYEVYAFALLINSIVFWLFARLMEEYYFESLRRIFCIGAVFSLCAGVLQAFEFLSSVCA